MQLFLQLCFFNLLLFWVCICYSFQNFTSDRDLWFNIFIMRFCQSIQVFNRVCRTIASQEYHWFCSQTFMYVCFAIKLLLYLFCSPINGFILISPSLKTCIVNITYNATGLYMFYANLTWSLPFRGWLSSQFHWPGYNEVCS